MIRSGFCSFAKGSVEGGFWPRRGRTSVGK